MKKQKKWKNIRFKASWGYQSPMQRVEEMELEDLVIYIHRAEKKALPIIKEIQASPTAAQFLLAQYTYVFATGSNQLSAENTMKIATKVLSLWKDGFYVPRPEYPFTLEETLQEIKGGIKVKKDYSHYFQAYIPPEGDQPLGIGQISAGIVKHPETNLWQVWVVVDGTCGYLGAYRNSADAQRNIEHVVCVVRKGGREAEYKAFSEKILSCENGLPMHIRFDVMEYLMDHIDLYTIRL